MKVQDKLNGNIVEAIKNEDGTYNVNGLQLSREEMAIKYMPVKDKPTEVSVDTATTQSESLGKLALALSKAQSEFAGVAKTSEGYGYNFADLNAVIQASAPIFTKYELAITQNILTKTIGKVFYAGVKTTLLHSSGEYMSTESFIPTERSKQNPLVQMFGVSTTYIRRYQYQAILGLATTDNDGSDK